MNIDGTDAKPIIEGKRIYSVNIEGDYVYYSDEAKELENEILYSAIEEDYEKKIKKALKEAGYPIVK